MRLSRSTRCAAFVLVVTCFGCGSARPDAADVDAGTDPTETTDGAARDRGDAREGDAPSRSDASPMAPEAAGLDLSVRNLCATAVVVGVTWSALPGAKAYSVSRDGAILGKTASLVYSDTTVTPSTSFAYTVTALGSTGHVLATSLPLSVRTSAASSNGDPAYCPSSLIGSMTWNWSSGMNQQNGSDLWPVTWGADGNLYTFFGDGGGFFGSDTLGRASFGIARITATTPGISSTTNTNVYGGLNASHPSSINGKAGSLIAIGSSFYAIGSIYRTGETGGPSGAPNHSEIVYSDGNAYSWQDSAWSFCNDTDNLDGFCPGSFINYGKGNEGARDAYVYVMGTTAANFFSTTGVPGPAYTYLVRVPNTALLTQSAYQAFTGLDDADHPLWSPDLTQMQPIFTDHGPRPIGIGEAVYNPVLQRYIATGQGTIGQAAFYESINPWGPWYSIGYYNTNPDGTGGWGDMGLAQGVTGGDSLGINFVNAWTSTDGLTMWAQFSSDGMAPASTELAPLAGKAFDSYSLVSVTLGM